MRGARVRIGRCEGIEIEIEIGRGAPGKERAEVGARVRAKILRDQARPRRQLRLLTPR